MCDHAKNKQVTFTHCMCKWLEIATRISNCWCTMDHYNRKGEEYKKENVLHYAMAHSNKVCEDPKQQKSILRVADCPNEKCEIVKKWNPLGWHYYECILEEHKSKFIPKEQ